MPLLDIQIEILKALSVNRSADSYIAGGTISGMNSPRYSMDIDIFHSSDDGTLKSYQEDRSILESLGYQFKDLIIRKPGFVRALVTHPEGESIRMDWAHESSFRFFPILESDLMGHHLHWADAATNKALAAGGREKTRDAYDLLYWDNNPLSLGAIIWAAVGKDAGLSPSMLLEDIRRNARISPDELEMLNLKENVDPIEISTRFRAACREARELLDRLFELKAPTGCLFLDETGEPVNPIPEDPSSFSKPHYGSVRGCWPTFPDHPYTFEP